MFLCLRLKADPHESSYLKIRSIFDFRQLTQQLKNCNAPTADRTQQTTQSSLFLYLSFKNLTVWFNCTNYINKKDFSTQKVLVYQQKFQDDVKNWDIRVEKVSSSSCFTRLHYIWQNCRLLCGAARFKMKTQQQSTWRQATYLFLFFIQAVWRKTL